MKIVKYFLILIIGVGIGFSFNRKKTVENENVLESEVATATTESPIVVSHETVVDIQNKKDADLKSPNSKQSEPVVQKVENKSIFQMSEEFDQRMNEDNLEKAQSVLVSMEKKEPRSRYFQEANGRYLVRTREFEMAKSALQECLKLYSKSKSCLIDMASVEAQIGTKEEKEKSARVCLSAVPGDPQCGNLLGMAKMNQGHYNEAITIYEQLLKSNGDGNFRFAESLLESQLAYALEGANRYDEALRHFEKICLRHPDDFADACRQAETLRLKL